MPDTTIWFVIRNSRTKVCSTQIGSTPPAGSTVCSGPYETQLDAENWIVATCRADRTCESAECDYNRIGS